MKTALRMSLLMLSSILFQFSIIASSWATQSRPSSQVLRIFEPATMLDHFGLSLWRQSIARIIQRGYLR